MLTLTRMVRPLVLASVLLAAGPTPGRAQDSGIVTPNREASALIHSLMSPYCPGLLLTDCKSEGGFALRAEITRRIETGEPSDAIEQDLVARFGPTIRTVPAREGIGLIVWFGPALIGALGLALAMQAVRRFTRGHGPTADEVDQLAADIDGGLGERLHDQLAALD